MNCGGNLVKSFQDKERNFLILKLFDSKKLVAHKSSAFVVVYIEDCLLNCLHCRPKCLIWRPFANKPMLSDSND